MAAFTDFRAANYDYEAARCQLAMAALYRHIDNEPEAQAAQEKAKEIFNALSGVV